MKRKLSTLTAFVILISVTAFGGSSPANAAVWNCTTGVSSLGAWSKCLSGDGNKTYRTAVLCQNWITRQSRTVYGQWVTVDSGKVSVVPGCGSWVEHYVGQPRATTGK